MGSAGPLAGVRIVDLTDERGIYGAKLLADLGADVLRPEPPGGDPLRQRGPHAASDGSSLWHAFFASSRRFVTLDPGAARSVAQLQQLVEQADVVITCDAAFGVDLVDFAAARAARPSQVVVAVSSFGDTGPWRDLLAPDLIAGALGGIVATTGTPQTTPLKTFGELNFMTAGSYTAIAALSALHHARQTGEGQRVGVPVHECIAACIEHVLMFAQYSEKLGRNRLLPRQGGTNWTLVYEVVPTRNGAMMVTPTPDFDNQLAWLIEEGVEEDLLDPKYSEPENAVLYNARIMDVLRRWVANKDAEPLFFEAQSRHTPYGWVLPLDRLRDNPQLAARNWWVPYRIGNATVRGPGAPYLLSATPWQHRDSSTQDAADLLAELSSVPPARHVGGSAARRPLEGLRVLDFTHVLAGPFCTRALADMGADVVKVNSHVRAITTNSPEHPYYVMWNRNKRALALDMTNADAKALCRKLCEQADIVIDNFAVGVLNRWGVGYEEVSQHNPKVIYAQMSGMGEGGPWSGFVTFAPTIHAISGLTRLTSVPGREDIGIGVSYNDHQAGLHSAVALLSAVAARQRTGRGQRVDMSQFEVGVNFLGPQLLDLFANDHAAEPTGNTLPYDAAAPHGVYPCIAKGDGTAGERWVAIACMTDSQWRAFCGLLGHPAWTQVPALATANGRMTAIAEIDAQVATWTSTQHAEDVMARCQAAGVPAGVVQDGVDLMECDPQLRHAQFLRPVADPDDAMGPMLVDRLPLRFEKTPCETYRRVRRVGEDNVGVLKDWLGMSEAQVRDGEANGVLR